MYMQTQRHLPLWTKPMLNMFRSSSSNARPDPRELVRMGQTGEAVVIDIREPGEVQATGKAACAIHIPLATLRMKADPSSPECHPALKNDKPVVLYCASGGRASMAQQIMQQMGHKQVYNLGGLMHWQQAGGTIVR